MKFQDKIFVSGHAGLVGSAIVRQLEKLGYKNIVTKTRKELDLTDQFSVDRFFDIERPDYVFLAAAKVGGINYNKLYPADFITENLQIQTNVIKSSYDYRVKKLAFLGSACFTKGHVVFTQDGYKNIEDVNIGDKILTHKNHFKEVYNIFTKNVSDTITIKSVGVEDITCTPDHKFLTKDRGWVEAENLNSNDFLCISKKYPKNNINNLQILNNDDLDLYNRCHSFVSKNNSPKTQEEHRWHRNSLPRVMDFQTTNFNTETDLSISYLIGAFLAEGWLEYNPSSTRSSKHSVVFSPGFDQTYISNIEKSIESVAKIHKKMSCKTSEKLFINNKQLCEFFTKFYSDPDIKRAHTKRIPEEIYELSNKSIIQIIKGYWDGDGCIHERKDRENQYTCVAASTSKELIYGIRRLLLSLGIFSSIHYNKKKKTCLIEGREVNQKDQYSIRINGKYAIEFLNIIYGYNLIGTTNRNNILESDLYYFSKVKSVTHDKNETQVYDLTIDEDHSYNINDIIVHNCIYPKITPQPIKEEYLLTGPLEPTNDAYAIAKIAGLTMCQKYSRQYGFNCISLMPTNLYGIEDRFNVEHGHVIPGLINKFVTAKENGDPTITCWGDGSPTREFMFSEDLADACIFLMNNYDSDEIINVGIDNEITMKELAEKLKVLTEFDGEIVWDTSKPNGTPRRKVCTEKLYNLGWRPKYSLEEGLKISIQWFKENKGNCK